MIGAAVKSALELVRPVQGRPLAFRPGKKPLLKSKRTCRGSDGRDDYKSGRSDDSVWWVGSTEQKHRVDAVPSSSMFEHPATERNLHKLLWR